MLWSLVFLWTMSKPTTWSKTWSKKLTKSFVNWTNIRFPKWWRRTKSIGQGSIDQIGGNHGKVNEPFWKLLMLSPTDKDYSNRKKKISLRDRSLLKKVEDMAPWAFREVFPMTRHVIEIFLAECEPWLPPGLSSNGRSISPWLQILIFLYYVTGAIPFCHLAVAAGLKKSTRQKIIRKVVNSLIDNGFVTRWITRITEVLHWLMNHVK